MWSFDEKHEYSDRTKMNIQGIESLLLYDKKEYAMVRLNGI